MLHFSFSAAFTSEAARGESDEETRKELNEEARKEVKRLAMGLLTDRLDDLHAFLFNASYSNKKVCCIHMSVFVTLYAWSIVLRCLQQRLHFLRFYHWDCLPRALEIEAACSAEARGMSKRRPGSNSSYQPPKGMSPR